MACYAIGSQMTLRCRKIFCSHSGTLRQLYAPTFVPPFTQKIGSYRGLLASLFKLHGSQRLQQPVSQRVIVAFSFTPRPISTAYERGVPSVADRLQAMQQLAEQGWPLGLRLDPLIDDVNFKAHYAELIQQIFTVLSPEAIHSVSIGPLRFPKKMFARVARLYPDEKLFSQPFESRAGHMSYSAEREAKMREYLSGLLRQHVDADKLFSCSVI